MRSLAAVVLGTTVLASSAFAAGTDTGVLAAGKPAGVKQAQLQGNGLMIAFGLAIVGGGIALVTTQGNSGNAIAVTTTATP